MIAGLSIEFVAPNGEVGQGVLERLTVAFERTGDELENFGELVFPRLTPVFEAEMAKQFQSEGSGPSGHWQQLSADYEAWKSKHYPGNPILEATGRMKEGLTESSSPFATRAFSGNDFEFGTSGVEYASYHQLGTTAGLPARPLFDFSTDFERDLTDAAFEAAREAVQKSGLAEFSELTP